MILLTGAVLYLFFICFSQNFGVREVFVCKTTDTMAYDLFDKQFSHLLTVITILIGAFGLAIPLSTYFFQYQNLKEERDKVDKMITEKLAELNALKQTADEISRSLADCNMGLVQFYINMVQESWDSFHKTPSADKIIFYLSFLGQALKHLCRSNDRETLREIVKFYTGVPARFQETSSNLYQEAVDRFSKDQQQKRNFISLEELAASLGEVSLEYKAFVEAYKPLFF